MSEILDTARAVIAAGEAHDTALDMADYARVAPAPAREVVRLRAAVTDEDREAAGWFEGAVEREERHAAVHRESLAHCPPDDPGYASLSRLAVVADTYAARYRRAAEALLRPDETAALRAEVAALKAALAAARAAAFKEAAKAVDAEAAEYAEGAHEDPSVTLYVNVLRETEKKIRALAAKENT